MYGAIKQRLWIMTQEVYSNRNWKMLLCLDDFILQLKYFKYFGCIFPLNILYYEHNFNEINSFYYKEKYHNQHNNKGVFPI